MAFNLEEMTIDYKKMFRMVPTDRATLAQSGVVNDLISSLTPGQLANLFPRYYRDRLPDIGTSATGGASLGGALSDFRMAPFSGRSGGGSYTTVPAPPSKSAQELAVERILKDNNIIPKTSVAAPSESGFFGAIMRAEGTDLKSASKRGFASSYDVVLGYGQYGLPDKPLSEMTIAEVYDFQRNVLLKNHGTSSAAGAFQIVSDNIFDRRTNDLSVFMKRAGLTMNDKFDEAAQRKLAYEIYKEQGLGAWEGFKFNQAELRIAQAEAENVRIETASEEIKRLEELKAELVPLEEEIRKKLDAKTLEIYDKAGPEQKWNIEHAIRAVGVDKFNESVKEIAKTEKNVNETASLVAAEGAPTMLPVGGSMAGKSITSEEAVPFSGGSYGSRSFGGPRGTNQLHTGVDIPGQPGDPVLAVDNGVIVDMRKSSSGYGYTMDVQYPDGTIHRMSHLGTNENGWEGAFAEGLKPGDTVSAGQRIGTLGYSGNAGAEFPHVHYEVIKPDYYEKYKGRPPGRISGRTDASMEELESGRIDPREWYAKRQEEFAKQQEAAKSNSDSITVAQNNVQQPPTELPAVAVPGLSTGGTVPMTPGENIAGINTNTGQVEFMSNDRELYTKDDQGNLRVDPSTIRQDELPVQSAPTQNLEAPTQPLQRKTQAPVPQDNPDPNFLNTMTSGSMASSPSQLRALNRARLYSENSSDLVNGHFS